MRLSLLLYVFFNFLNFWTVKKKKSLRNGLRYGEILVCKSSLYLKRTDNLSKSLQQSTLSAALEGEK